MSSQPSSPKGLRLIVVVLMGLTAVVTLLSGIGVTCVALGPERWGPRMAGLAPYQWLYQLFVVVLVAAGAVGIYATIGLARGRRRSYTTALIVLAIGLVATIPHVAASRTLRGASQPNDMRLYVTALTLAVLLLFRLPGLWQRVGLTERGGGDPTLPGGLALFVGGLAALSTLLWAAPTHIGPDGAQWVNVLRTPLLLGGAGMTVTGIALLRRADRATVQRVNRLAETMRP